MNTDSRQYDQKILTIVIPVFNTNVSFISQALDSIAGQSLDNQYYDLIIVDDGSTDPDTCEFLDSLSQCDDYQGVSLTLIRHDENRWLAQARITGAKATDAEFIAFLDSDDYIENDYLKKAILLLKSNYGAAWVYPSVSVFGQYHELRIAERFRPFCFFLRNKMPYACVFRRSIWLKVLQREKIVVDSIRFFEDWDTIIRLMAKGYFGTPLRDSKLFYRKHSASLLNRSTKLYLLSIYTTWHSNLYKLPLVLISYIRNKRIQKKFTGKPFIFSPARLFDNLQKYLFRQALEEPQFQVVLDLKSLFFAFLMPSFFKKRFLDSEKTITLAEIRCGFLRKPTYEKLSKISYGSDQEKENILFAHTWWTIGGAEQVLLEWIKTANKQLGSYKLLDLCHIASDSDVKQTFSEYVGEQFCLQDTGSTPYERLAYCWSLICHDRPQVIFISGNAFLYALSPLIKKYFPEITLIDILHNEWNNHIDWFNVAAGYQNYLDYRIVISAHWRNVLIEKYKEKPEKIHIIKNFIDTDVFDPKRYVKSDKIPFLSVDNDKCIVTFIGRLHEQKDPIVFLKVAEKLQKYEEFHFIVVGDGPLKQQIEDLCAELNNVTFLGERSDIADILASTNILLCTSKYEGYPLVSLEAAAMQVPIIAPNIVGFSEQVEAGNFGLLYQATGNSDKDASSIVMLLKNNKQQILDMGKKGSDFIAKHHETELIRSKQEYLLDLLLKSTTKQTKNKSYLKKIKKKELYLHVGMHKTGTTTIQHFLYHNRKALSSNGVLYPSKHTYGFAHHEASNFFSKKKNFLPDFIESRYKNRTNWEAAINAQKKEMLLSSLDKHILSSETFMRCNHAMVRDFYNEFDVKIIIFLRRQDVWLESTLNQNLKMNMNMETGLEHHTRKKEKNLDYYRLLKLWAEHFGSDNLIIVPFQKSLFQDSLEAQFLQLIGVPWNADFKRQKAKNTRLNRDCISYLSDFPEKNRARNPEFHRIVELLQNYSEMKPDQAEYKFTYSPQQRLSVLAKYSESNQRVAKEFLQLESGVIFSEPEPSIEEPWAPYPGLNELRKNEITQYLHDNGINIKTNEVLRCVNY